MNKLKPPRFSKSEQGATIVTFSLMIVLLLGFVGIALDYSRLFIVKAELQTAMDSCALAGAQELDGKANARDRSRKAGVLSANLNSVNLQSANWDGELKTIEADIEVLDAAMGLASTDAQARYVRCMHTQAGVASWVLKVMALRTANTGAYPSDRSVLANAIATRGSAQSTCPVPVGLIAKPSSTGPNWGYAKGDWVVALSDSNSKDDSLVPGEMGWFNLDGSKSASITNSQLSEKDNCDTVDEQVATLLTPGKKVSVSEQWNYRFGIYKSDSDSRSANRPDTTGYAYTPDSWPSMNSAYGDFLTRRAAYQSFGTVPNGGPFKSSSTSAQHQANGYNRRIVLVPVVQYMGDRDYRVKDFACMLLLGPMKIYKKEDVYMEYLGDASESGSPCTSGGKPGGTAGPLVPVLVR